MDQYQNPYSHTNYENQPQGQWRGRGRGRGGGQNWRGQGNWQNGGRGGGNWQNGGRGRGGGNWQNAGRGGGGGHWRAAQQQPHSHEHAEIEQSDYDEQRFVIPRMTQNPWARLEQAHEAKRKMKMETK